MQLHDMEEVMETTDFPTPQKDMASMPKTECPLFYPKHNLWHQAMVQPIVTSNRICSPKSNNSNQQEQEITPCNGILNMT